MSSISQDSHDVRLFDYCVRSCDFLCPQDSHEYRCVFRYTPHSRGINGLVFPSSPSSPLLYTCSYDGTLRCANLEKGIFDEVRIQQYQYASALTLINSVLAQVYSLPEDNDQGFYSCDISRQSDWLVLGQTDGSVVQLDPRGKPNTLH